MIFQDRISPHFPKKLQSHNNKLEMTMAKANENKTKEEPLEKQLWKAADKLRKNIDAAEYKHVVMGLIFLKYISDSFEEMFGNRLDDRRASAKQPAPGLLPQDMVPFQVVRIEGAAADRLSKRLGRHTIGHQACHQRARAGADVDVEFIGPEARERLVKRRQAPDFKHPPGHPTPCQGQGALPSGFSVPETPNPVQRGASL